MATDRNQLIVQGVIDSLTTWGATGWAWIPDLPDEKLKIQAVINGEVVGSATANELRADLVREGKGGTGHCGFTLTFKRELFGEQTPTLEAIGQSVTASLTAVERSSVIGFVDRLNSLEAYGWAWMPALPDRALEIEAVLDERVIGRAIANHLRPDLASSGRGTGRYGFHLSFDFPMISGSVPAIKAKTEEGSVQLQCIENAFLAAPEEKLTGRTGSVESCSGYIVSGWAWDSSAADERLLIDIFIDEENIGTVAAEWFREDLLAAGIGDGRHAFYFESSRYLDGRSVSVRFAIDGARLANIATGQQHDPKDSGLDDLPLVDSGINLVSLKEKHYPDAPIIASQQLRRDVADWSDEIASHFDANWYRETYLADSKDDAAALNHFLDVGIYNEQDPHILFSSKWYTQRYLSSKSETTPAILHYIKEGANNGLNPHPLFHVNWYSNQFSDFSSFCGTPLQHFIKVGTAKGISCTPIFDSTWYRRTYLTDQDTSKNAFIHYMRFGAAQGNNPNAFFDVDFYLQQFPTLTQNDHNLLVHYLESGAEKGADPSIRFKTSAYLEANPDVQRAKRNPLEHFMRSGRQEGRSPLGEQSNRNSPNAMSSIFSRFGGQEYGPVEKVLSYASSIVLPSRPPSLCVHVHLFHTDLADEISLYLDNIQMPYTLMMSVREGDHFDWAKHFTSRHAHIEQCLLKRVPNRGRDVAPWVTAFADEILHHELFFHCHTKKSEYDPRFASWRRYLIHNTLGSKSLVNEIVTLFDTDTRLGLIYPAYFPELSAQPSWGGNRDKARILYERLGAVLPERCPDYPAGSFFWARVELLRPLLTCGLGIDDFDLEAAQIDGTLAHSIERMLGHFGQFVGMTSLCVTADVGYNLTDFWDTKRRDKTLQPSSITYSHPPHIEALGDNRRVVVYTCITGGFDELVEPMFVHSDVDYVIFSDHDLPQSPYFKKRECQYVDPNPRRTARYVKTHPHIILREYDVAIWLDANIMFKTSLTPFLKIIQDSGADIGVVYHTIRSGFIEEAAECARIGADERDVLEDQTSKYKADAISNDNLIETNFFIALLSRPNVRRFFDVWWAEICRFSLRDQVSVNYALSLSGASTTALLPKGRSVRDDGRFLIFEHKVVDRKPIVEFVQNYQTAFPNQKVN